MRKSQVDPKIFLISLYVGVAQLSEPKAPVWGLGAGESRSSYLISSQMAGPIWLKLSGVVEDRGENVLAKEFF